MCLLIVIVNLLGILCICVAKDTVLSLSAPVNPVEEGGVFGLHCQVWNLKDFEEVSILKVIGPSGKTNRLTLNDVAFGDDSTFLARRQLGDGSTVFFLSIIAVSKEHAGDYKCRVTDTSTVSVVTSQDVSMDVTYFPDETEPLCSTNRDPIRIPEGSEIKLNCSSKAAVPEIDLQWKRPGDNLPPIKGSLVKSGSGSDTRVSSIVKFRPTLADSGSVFLCEVTSTAFPGKVQACHIGPITVTPNNNPRFTLPTEPSNPVYDVSDLSTTIAVVSLENPAHECHDICFRSYSSQKLYWIIATAGATVVALIFLILVMTLCLKYSHLDEHNSSHLEYALPQYPLEKIYSEVESRRIDDRVYMSLVKQKQQSQHQGTCLQDVNVDGRYHSPNLELK